MKVPVSWLKEFVPVKAGADEIARRLTLSGFEVEEILTVEGDAVLEVNVTPNRGDCLSIFGIAREVSAIFHVPLRFPRIEKFAPSKGKSPVTVRLQAAKKCPRYSLAVLSGVKVGSSPDRLARRLAQVGIRSINNVVDVTNYVLMELGQPLHAFDRKKIRGEKILVRKARNQEKILTLDGEERELISDDLVIADSEGAIALAGIMGGKDTEIDENSTTAALESAFFESSGIRKTARRLGIQTESSYRFERGIDPEGVIRALQRAAQLIQELAGGVMAGPLTDFYPGRSPGRKILFSPARVEALLGGDWPVSRVKRNFGKLSFQVQRRGKGRRNKDQWEVSVPSYRPDIQREADLIEEAARFEGLEKIPTTFPPLVAAPVSENRASRAEQTVRHLLADLGLREAVHFSFLSPEDLSHFDPSLLDRAVPLENPLGREYSLMRPTLLPSLLRTAALHHRHKISTVRLFELRNRFEKAEGRIAESKTLSGVLTGHRLLSHWSDHVRETDFYDLKGLVERLFREMRILKSTFAASMAPFLHPNQQAAAMIGGRTVGLLGEVHPDLLSRFDLKRAAFVFELDWGALADLRSSEKQFESYSLHPVVERDLALVVEESVAAASLLEFIHGQDPAIWNVSLFDLYRGPQIPEGKKSLAFAIQIGRKNQTLTEGEVNAVYGRLVENLKQTFRAEVR